MAEKYWCLTFLRGSMFAWVGALLAALTALAKIFLRDPRRGDHHGFDLGEGLDHGTLACNQAFNLLRWEWKLKLREIFYYFYLFLFLFNRSLILGYKNGHGAKS